MKALKKFHEPIKVSNKFSYKFLNIWCCNASQSPSLRWIRLTYFQKFSISFSKLQVLLFIKFKGISDFVSGFPDHLNLFLHFQTKKFFMVSRETVKLLKLFQMKIMDFFSKMHFNLWELSFEIVFFTEIFFGI